MTDLEIEERIIFFRNQGIMQKLGIDDEIIRHVLKRYPDQLSQEMVTNSIMTLSLGVPLMEILYGLFNAGLFIGEKLVLQDWDNIDIKEIGRASCRERV